jgi:hypothetical protein
MVVPSTQVCRPFLSVILRLFRNEADGIQEFEIALEIDSAEIRAILLYEDHEWGR